MDNNYGETKMEKYKFSNRVMFAIVMQDSNLCKQFIERVFPDKKVAKINMLTTEKTIYTGITTKSVRLDAMFEGDDKVYDIEMQVATENALPQRIRYYHSAIDRQILDAGENYEDLRDSYVIFICRYDPFGLGKAVYQFKTMEENSYLKLEDGCNTIVLNTKCLISDVPEVLRPFFEYIEEGKVEQDDFVHEIDDKVEKANLDEEVRGIMTIGQEIELWRKRAEKAYEKGEQAGVERGSAQREQEIARNLIALGLPTEQIIKATGLSPEEIERLKQSQS